MRAMATHSLHHFNLMAINVKTAKNDNYISEELKKGL